MPASSYTYYKYDGMPCRVENKPLGEAQIYVQGSGLVDGPKMTIINDGTPISKATFDAMIIALTRKRTTDA